MNNSFISIRSTGGRIGRFCWVNGDTRGDHRSGTLATWQDGQRAWIPLGWWGSIYFCSPHPATPGDAW